MRLIRNLKIAGILLFAGIAFSLFLPFFETLTDGMQDDRISFIRQYESKDGYLTTYNGFGSLFCIFNLILSVGMLFTVFAKGDRYALPMIGLGLYILSQLLVLAGQSFAGALLTKPDHLLSGYWIMTCCEGGLMLICFLATRNR